MKINKLQYLLLIFVTICLITSCNKECKHQSTDWIIDKQATCTEDGSKHKECTVCHEKLVTEVIEALGHDLVHHEKEDPTCTKKGHKAYDTCTRCSYTTYEELPATGHTESDWIIDVEATCTEKGSKHKECTVCHEKLVTEVIEAIGHDLVHHEKEDPTCTKKGHKAYDTCTRCDYTTYEELLATGHAESDWIIDVQATCTENGSKHKECTVCHEKLVTEVIEAIGHIVQDGICTRCGNELTSSDLLYELTSDNTGYIVTGLDYTKYDTNVLTVIIPSEYNGLPVVEIKKEAFKSINNIKKIILSNSIISIGDYAFYGCTSLTSIEIPNSVTNIGKSALEGCNDLKSIALPFIGNGSYKTHFGYIFGANSYRDNNCVPTSLKKVIVTNTTSISDHSFYGCTGLTSIEIPNSVTSIGYSAFYNCTGLTSITLPFIGNGSDETRFGYIFGTDNKYVPTSLKKVIITGGKSIGSSAFYDCTSLTSIEIPNSVTSIGDSAFRGCTSLTNIEIPNSVTSIEYYAFIGCTSLTNVYYNGTIEDWCNISFNGSYSNPMEYANHFFMIDENNEYEEVTEIVIPETVTKIGNYQFCGLKNVMNITIPNSVTSIGYSAFSGCTGLTSITLPFIGNGSDETHFGYIFGANSYSDNLKNVPESLNEIIITNAKSIGDSAFYGCTALKSVEVTESITSIRDSAVRYMKLTIIVSSNNVTNIGDSAFMNCSGLTSVVLPCSVKNIGKSAFSGCVLLTNIEIPNNVTSIGESAFSGCRSLTNIYYNGTIEDWCNISFDSYSSNPMHYVSHLYMLDANNRYKEITKGKEIVIPETVTKIGNYQFCGLKNVTNITIPNSVTSIGSSAFEGCTSLTSIEIPNSVTSIGSSAFRGCTSLTSIEIPNSVTSIENYAFRGCTSLTSIEIPNSVTSIGGYAFDGCTSLTSIEIPNSVTSIVYSAFYGCNSLTYNIYDNCKYLGNDENPYLVLVEATNTSMQSISINPNTKIIGSSAFEGCTSLTSIEIPNSVTSIENYAFYDCTSLTSIKIPNSVTSIGSFAFSGCTSLTSIKIPNSVTSIGDYAFEYCTSLTIYCEALKKPSRWSNKWNPSNCNVVWGYKKSN